MLSQSVIALVAALGVTFTGNILFASDNATSVGAQDARASAVYTNLMSSATASTTNLSVGTGGTVLDKMINTSVTVDVDNLIGGHTTSIQATVTGVVAGDWVHVGRSGDWKSTSSTIAIIGSAIATNTVEIVWKNASTSAVNLTSTSYPIFSVSR